MEGIDIVDPQANGEEDNPYKYNGKEYDEALGLSFYGFRLYDPAIGRFTGVDPISDKFPWVSSYNYAENEPIANIDLHGLQALSYMFKLLQRTFDYALGNTSAGNVIQKVDENEYALTYKAQKSSEQGVEVMKDLAIVAGGVTTTIISGGTGTGPYLAAFGVTSGIIASSAGVTKLALDVSGKSDISSEIPTGLLGATVGVVVKSQVDNKEVVQTINATLSIVEGAITFNIVNPKNASNIEIVDNLANLFNNASSIDVISQDLNNLVNNNGQECSPECVVKNEK